MSEKTQVTDMQAHQDAGLDPLMAKSFKELFADIPKRFVALLNKALQKEFILRVMAFIFATLELRATHLSEWAWLVITGILIFGEKFLGFLGTLKK